MCDSLQLCLRPPGEDVAHGKSRLEGFYRLHMVRKALIQVGGLQRKAIRKPVRKGGVCDCTSIGISDVVNQGTMQELTRTAHVCRQTSRF